MVGQTLLIVFHMKHFIFGEQFPASSGGGAAW